MQENNSFDLLFPETRWSLVAQAVGCEDEQAKQAVRDLLKAYWPPIYSAIKFGWQKSDEETQHMCEIFLSQLISKPNISETNKGKGRFRDYLKAELRTFMQSQPDQTESSTSGIVMDPACIVEVECDKPETVFDESWILLVMQNAIKKMKNAFSGEDTYIYRVFYVFDVEGQRPETEQLAKQLEIDPELVLPALFQARRRFRRHLIEEVHEYALDQEDAQGELRWLLD